MLILTDDCEKQLDVFWDVNRPVYDKFDTALNDLEANPASTRFRKHAIRTESGATSFVVYVGYDRSYPFVLFWRPRGEDVEVFWLGQWSEPKF